MKKIMAILIVAVLCSCNSYEREYKQYQVKAESIGSGCSAFGCVTTVIIRSGKYSGQTCQLTGTDIQSGQKFIMRVVENPNFDNGFYCDF